MKNNPALVYTGESSQKIMSGKIIPVLLIAHIALAFVVRSSGLFATLYALITIGVGLYIALVSNNPKRIVWITAYIVGAEVLWRMTGANIFYETGKYAIIAILTIGFFRNNRGRNAALPILYIILLSISIPLTIFSQGFSQNAREMISFNLSGPLALGVCVLYFSQIKLDLKELQQVAWGITLPTVSILVLAAYSTFSTEKVIFYLDSNFLTSGGFGPNQVSALLGLGAVMMFMVFITTPKIGLRLLSIGLMIAFLIQSALTFSRGGIYNVVVCIFLAVVHFLFQKKGKGGVFIFLIFLSVIGGYFFYPQLDQFTGGLLTQRFQDVDTTGRVVIAQADIAIWERNILLGVGPGVSAYEAAQYFGRYVAAHTEYTRLLAEHGIPGILAIGLLAAIAIRAYFRAPGLQSKVWVVVLIAWPLVEMSHAAMRVAAISFLFGLANAVWVVDHKSQSKAKNPLTIEESL